MDVDTTTISLVLQQLPLFVKHRGIIVICYCDLELILGGYRFCLAAAAAVKMTNSPLNDAARSLSLSCYTMVIPLLLLMFLLLLLLLACFRSAAKITDIFVA